MADLNLILVGVGIMMYVVPAISVFSALGACCFVVYRHNKLETNYINKHKLLDSLELELKDSTSENDVEIEVVDLQANDVGIIGTESEGEFVV